MKYAIEEATGTLMLRMGKYLFRIALLHNAALIDKDDTICHRAREPHFMGYYHHRAPFFGQLAHDAQHLAHQLRIQR